MKDSDAITSVADHAGIAGGSWENVHFPDDYRRVRALLNGDEHAEGWFNDTYGAQIMQTALNWCRPNCIRGDCRLKGGRLANLTGRFFGSDCDEVNDAIVFLLGEIKGRVLRVYEGGTSLRSWLFPIFTRVARRDGHRGGCNYFTLFASYLAWKRGKYVPPKWVTSLQEFDRNVHREATYGRDARTTSLRLKCDLADVEASMGRIEAAARQAGPETLWAWSMTLNAGEVSLEQPLAGGEEQRTIGDTIPSDQFPVEHLAKRSEAQRLIVAALERLDESDRELLYLRCYDRLTGEAVAAKWRIPMKKVYEQEQRALEGFNRCMTEINPSYKPLSTKELRDGLRGFGE